MPTTRYDQDAERINRQRSPWWHKWLFLGVAVGTADGIRERIVAMALEIPELSPRELATRFIDAESWRGTAG